jgi:hypothetical protein
VLAVVVAVVAGASVARAVVGGNPAPASAQRSQAARQAAAERRVAAVWMAAQIIKSALVSCDPVMCAALHAHGFPAGELAS